MLALVLVYQQVENHLLQPTIVGRAARVSGFFVLASVLAARDPPGPGPEPRRPIVPFVRRRLVLRGATLLPMFTEGRLAMALSTRELAYRRDGGIEVALLWNTVTGRLTVTVADLASGEAFQLPVAPDRALDGFYHPYAYAASMGVVYGDAPLHALYA
jgi:hypothetical protein